MTRDITEFVLSCAYCRLSNATSHEAQSILQAIETQEPFDVIFLDVWTPGDFPAKW
jgi:CheY-like chemotaxis protein